MTRQIFSFKNHTEYERGRLVPDLFLFFKKGLYEVKPSAVWLSFNISTVHKMGYNKKKFLKP